jgi:hypothetical protein
MTMSIRVLAIRRGHSWSVTAPVGPTLSTTALYRIGSGWFETCS